MSSLLQLATPVSLALLTGILQCPDPRPSRARAPSTSRKLAPRYTSRRLDKLRIQRVVGPSMGSAVS